MDCTCTSLVSELLWMFKWYCDKIWQHWTWLSYIHLLYTIASEASSASDCALLQVKQALLVRSRHPCLYIYIYYIYGRVAFKNISMGGIL